MVLLVIRLEIAHQHEGGDHSHYRKTLKDHHDGPQAEALPQEGADQRYSWLAATVLLSLTLLDLPFSTVLSLVCFIIHCCFTLQNGMALTGALSPWNLFTYILFDHVGLHPSPVCSLEGCFCCHLFTCFFMQGLLFLFCGMLTMTIYMHVVEKS